MTARLLLLVAIVATTTGCYLSHQRRHRDGGPDAAPPHDAGRDARMLVTDAGVRDCSHLIVAATTMLDPGVTPRLAALPAGDGVGVVYVRSDGSPVRVIYERIDARLERLTGPIPVMTESFTWAEIAIRDGTAWIASGLAGDRASSLVQVTLDGAPIASATRVPLHHPSLFAWAGDTMFWAAFAMRDENALEVARIDAAGNVITGPSTIALGRYGSGHDALVRGDGSVVLAYPREGPPGTRHGHVRIVSPDGSLGPERELGPMDSDEWISLAIHERELVIARHADDRLILERADPITLERIARTEWPEIDAAPNAAVIEGHLAIAHTDPGVLAIDDFGLDHAGFERLTVPLPGSTVGRGISVAEIPGAAILATTINVGTDSFPWLVLVECSVE